MTKHELAHYLKEYDDYLNQLLKQRRALRAILKRCAVSLELAGCPPEREPLVTARKVLKRTTI